MLAWKCPFGYRGSQKSYQDFTLLSCFQRGLRQNLNPTEAFGEKEN